MPIIVLPLRLGGEVASDIPLSIYGKYSLEKNLMKVEEIIDNNKNNK